MGNEPDSIGFRVGRLAEHALRLNHAAALRADELAEEGWGDAMPSVLTRRQAADLLNAAALLTQLASLYGPDQ